MTASASAERDPIEQLLDLVLYAPLGLVTQLDDLLPGLVERGRSQAVMARTIGQFAVRSGSAQVQSRVSDVQRQVDSLLRSFADLAASRRRNAASTSTTSSASTDGTASPAPTAAVAEPSSTLPIAGYDEMRAADIVPLLADLSADQRRTIEHHERANRARKTILARLAQLEAQQV